MNLYRLSPFLIILILFISAHAFAASETETSYFKPVKVAMVGLGDPGYISLELENGETITTTYEGIKWKVLSKWLEEQEKAEITRAMHLSYSDQDGVRITDNDTGIVFTLVGEIKKNHPIDLAIAKCRDKAVSTLDYQGCNALALRLWNTELDRIFDSIRIENPLLEEAWTQYLDAYTDFLHSVYGKREGPIWGLVDESHVIEQIRNQINLFGRVREW